MSALVEKLNLTIDRYWPARGLRLIGSNPGFRSPMYPYEALRGPTYREYSHVNHTWDPPPRLLLLSNPRKPKIRADFGWDGGGSRCGYRMPLSSVTHSFSTCESEPK